jgi:hypothetical protein
MARSDIHFGDGGVTTKMLATLALLTGLGGCSNAVDVDQCADPTKLRVKVADTVFDLPNTTDKPFSQVDDSIKDKHLGILGMTYTAYASNPANRHDCNSKEKRVADFGNGMGFRYKGEGTEPKDYRQGGKMNASVDIYRYDPTVSYQSDYLANVQDIEKVRFVRRVDYPRKYLETIKEASFEFAYENRRFIMECQVGNYKYQIPKSQEFKPRNPIMCVPDMMFRAGDIIISVDQQATRFYGDGRSQFIPPSEPIPPEEWPKQWAYTINKILSYRIKSGEGASQ